MTQRVILSNQLINIALMQCLRCFNTIYYYYYLSLVVILVSIPLYLSLSLFLWICCMVCGIFSCSTLFSALPIAFRCQSFFRCCTIANAYILYIYTVHTPKNHPKKAAFIALTTTITSRNGISWMGKGKKRKSRRKRRRRRRGKVEDEK